MLKKPLSIIAALAVAMTPLVSSAQGMPGPTNSGGPTNST